MLKEITHSLTSRLKLKNHFIPVYAATLLLAFHSFLVAYINSSFLEKFISPAGVGIIYITAAALSIIFFLIISGVLHRVGSFKLTIFLLLLDFLAVSGMAFSETLRTAVPLFLIHLISVPLIIFNIDVFMEAKIGNNESNTGSRRGLLLTLISLVGTISPLFSSSLINETTNSFTNAYILSAAVLLPIMMIMIFFFRDFENPKYNQIDLFLAIRQFWRNLNIRYVFLANFTLQIFFMATIVYFPLYLVGEIGLSWREFGVIMFFGHLAYVLFEYPIGIIADRYIGEKEMMGLGFLILAISISWMSFVTAPDILIWSIIMFTMRVGASLVEVTTESYFFKKTTSSDSQIISFFRITGPLAQIVGAAIASLALLYVPFNLLFIVFAFMMIPALFYTLNIEDTK
jgi:Major Facilitator Superfamily